MSVRGSVLWRSIAGSEAKQPSKMLFIVVCVCVCALLKCFHSAPVIYDSDPFLLLLHEEFAVMYFIAQTQLTA